ncbi:paraquat-inducible protein A [Thiocapsa roseopersicina]|uniref:Paraquat-inducible protein A n=1 Tax=Thiocapsa roseopersicina TaxID=1058 RepID=A0A1H2QWZ1_THIRO|nr:paraquat-inducible protein A [Thiocapsa roseopersicina]SDW11390.1 paraquat-inducible protein A [Thiocapsa roseopersicina]
MPRMLPTADIIACPGCDLLQRLPPVPPGARARCPRCGEILAAPPMDPIERPLALAVAATITFAVAQATPLMSLSAVGRSAQTTIIGGALEMWTRGQPITAALVLICTTLAPAAYLALVCTVLLAVRRPPAPSWTGALLRLAAHARAWSLPEVMLLGILVALVKIADLATVDAGVGLYATGALLALLAGLATSFDPRTIWDRVAWPTQDTPRCPGSSLPEPAGGTAAR